MIAEGKRIEVPSFHTFAKIAILGGFNNYSQHVFNNYFNPELHYFYKIKVFL